MQGSKLGMFLKDKFSGDFALNWDGMLKENDFEKVVTKNTKSENRFKINY